MAYYAQEQMGENSNVVENRKKRTYTPLSSYIMQHRDEYMEDTRDETPMPMVHNIVSTSRVICVDAEGNGEINLAEIYQDSFCCNYNKKRFAAITLRIDDPMVTALLFTSGRLVITGSKCWYECMLGSLMVAKILRKVQPHLHFYVQDCEVQNVVANVIIPGSTPQIPKDAALDIDAMMLHLNQESPMEAVCQYRKSLFPGLIYRPPNSPVVVLCFKSGRCVVTGGKNFDDIDLGWKLLWKKIRNFVVDRHGKAILKQQQQGVPSAKTPHLCLHQSPTTLSPTTLSPTTLSPTTLKQKIRKNPTRKNKKNPTRNRKHPI